MPPSTPAAPQIGVDGSSVVGPRTGIGNATACLLDGLGRHWPQDWPPLLAWINSARHPIPEQDPWRRHGSIRVRHTTLPGRPLMRSWQYLRWPPIERLAGGPLSLFHSPASYIFPARRAVRVLTVHDIYFTYAPHHVEPYGGGYFLNTFPRGLRRLDHIIAVTHFTRDELLRTYRLDPARVNVIPLAVEHGRFSPEAAPEDRAQLESAGLEWGVPYLLCLATAEPRKNLEGLISAYARLRALAEATQVEPPRLIVAGSAGWGLEPLRQLAQREGVAGYVTLTGYLEDAVLPALYRHAAGFVFPSLYEGFGIPVLEAMASGCPVAAAQAGSLPEVAAQAAHYFNPRDHEDMARALLELITQNSLRERLRQAGSERARLYNWDATARATIDLYARLLGQPRPAQEAG